MKSYFVVERSIIIFKTVFPQEGVTEASQGPCNVQYSPVTYLVPSQPGTPVLHPDYHQFQVPHGQPASSPFSELQYHIPSLPSTPFSDMVSPYSPTFAAQGKP